MEFTGRVTNINQNWLNGTFEITFSINEKSALQEIDKIKDCEKLSITAKKYRKARSIDANRLFWACVGEIANKLNADKWEIYLSLLRRYGQFTYICVKPRVVDAVKAQWRECEELGEIEINGEKAVQMLCYFGSHTYNTQEFSRLLDGTIEEMKEIGLQPPASEDMQRSLELWQNN